MRNLRFLRFLGAAAGVVIADYLLVLTDCMIAGRVLGESALGALNLLMPVFSVVTFFCWLLTSGTSKVYSRAFRRGEDGRVAGIVGQGLMASLALGGLLLLVVTLLERPYLDFLSPGDETAGLVGAYCRWYRVMIAVQPAILMLFYLAYVRGCERTCLYSFALTIALNAVVSYELSARMGMSGISLGTVLSLLVGGVVLTGSVFLTEKKARWSLRGDPRWLAFALRTSLAESAVWLFHAVLFLAIVKYVLSFWDSESLSVCAVIFCIIRLTTFFCGVGVVLLPLESAKDQTEGGAESVARVFRLGSTLAFAVMAISVTVFFVAPEPVIGLFGIESADLVVGAKRAARLTVLGLAAGGLVAFLPLLWRVRKSSFPVAPVNYLQSYVLSRMADGGVSRMFNLAKLFRLKKGIDLERLSRALVASGASHAALRSVLRRLPEGDVVQRMELGEAAVRCPVVKASEADLLADKSALVKEFPVFGKCLFEAKIFDCGERAYLLSNFHHLICDGYSFPLILEDAHRVWNGETLEPDAYYEVLSRRAEKAALPLAVAGRNFMREVLKDRSYSTLPWADFRGPSGYGTLEVNLSLPADFETFLSAHRATRHHVFLAATVLALSKFNGADDVLVDWVFHGRVSKDELKTVGAFMVDLPLIAEDCSGMTAADMLAHVKRATFNGIKGVNFYRSVADCNPTGEERLTFIYQDEWGELMTSGPVRPDGPYAWMMEETIPLTAPSAASENPFNVEIMEHRDATRLFVEYDTGRYAESSVRRYAELFCESLDEILKS